MAIHASLALGIFLHTIRLHWGLVQTLQASLGILQQEDRFNRRNKHNNITMEQILETGQKMGLNSEKLQEFVIEEQKRAKREAEAERQFNLQREKMKYNHDQAMEKIRQEQAHKLDKNVPINATMPELPVFEDDKDSIIYSHTSLSLKQADPLILPFESRCLSISPNKPTP